MVEIITKEISRATMVEIITKEISRATMVENITIDSTRATMEEMSNNRFIYVKINFWVTIEEYEY